MRITLRICGRGELCVRKRSNLSNLQNRWKQRAMVPGLMHGEDFSRPIKET